MPVLPLAPAEPLVPLPPVLLPAVPPFDFVVSFFVVFVFVVFVPVDLPCCPDVACVDPLGSSALLNVVHDSAANAVAAITHVRNVLMAHLPPPERDMRCTAAPLRAIEVPARTSSVRLLRPR